MVGREPDLNPRINWDNDLEAAEYWNKPWIIKENYKPLYDAGPSEPYYSGYLATPLIQVLSVRMSTYFDDGKPCEIYGSIRGPHFILFDRNLQDPEIVSKDDTLSLISPDVRDIVPSLSTILDFCLTDRVRDVEVVNEKLSLGTLTDYSYDKLQQCDVRGAHGIAHVSYVAFQFARYATVQVTVTKNNNNDNVNKCNLADIYGSVVAGYEDVMRYYNADHQGGCLETQLFYKPLCQPLRVMVGSPMRLCKNVVAVPAFSSLTIGVNLWDSNGKIAADSLGFPAFQFKENPSYIQTPYACVEVDVCWHDGYFHSYKDQNVKGTSKIGGDIPMEPSHKKLKASVDQNLSRPLPPRVIPFYGGLKAEVFTVFVGGITQKISALCGTIIIDDGSDKFSIYKRDESCCELLPDNGLACIEFNYRAIDNAEFGMILNLRDPILKLEVSNGDICWNVGLLQGTLSMYYKQLCSVVRGKDGFAAVHYEIFNNAFEALVEVKLFADGGHGIPVNLFGTLLARYSGHDYSTSYQKKYYRSRLFDHSEDRPVELTIRESGSEIALLKSIVAVPASSSLIIEANLGVLGIDNNVDDAITGVAEFEIDLGITISKEIQGRRYRIEAYVKFTS